jgi:hypothetical protein
MVMWFRIEGMEEVRTKEWLPTAMQAPSSRWSNWPTLLACQRT